MGVTILLLVAVCGGFVAVVAFAMWIARRLFGKWGAIGVAVVALGYLAYVTVTGVAYCSADPVFVPPSDADAAAGSEGRMVFNCDSAGGVLDRLFLYVIAPVMMLALSFMTLWTWQKDSRIET